jgi:hypothetical protein
VPRRDAPQLGIDQRQELLAGGGVPRAPSPQQIGEISAHDAARVRAKSKRIHRP